MLSWLLNKHARLETGKQGKPSLGNCRVCGAGLRQRNAWYCMPCSSEKEEQRKHRNKVKFKRNRRSWVHLEDERFREMSNRLRNVLLFMPEVFASGTSEGPMDFECVMSITKKKMKEARCCGKKILAEFEKWRDQYDNEKTGDWYLTTQKVISATEPWAEYQLEDGTTIRFRLTACNFRRTGKTTEQGDPEYSFSQQVQCETILKQQSNLLVMDDVKYRHVRPELLDKMNQSLALPQDAG